jgi:hypothetical protein
MANMFQVFIFILYITADAYKIFSLLSRNLFRICTTPSHSPAIVTYRKSKMSMYDNIHFEESRANISSYLLNEYNANKFMLSNKKADGQKFPATKSSPTVLNDYLLSISSSDIMIKTKTCEVIYELYSCRNQMKPIQLSKTFTNLVQMNCLKWQDLPTTIMIELLDHHLLKLSSRSITNILWCLGKLNATRLDFPVAFRQRLLKQLYLLSDEFNDRDLSMTLWGLHKLDYRWDM